MEEVAADVEVEKDDAPEISNNTQQQQPARKRKPRKE